MKLRYFDLKRHLLHLKRSFPQLGRPALLLQRLTLQLKQPRVHPARHLLQPERCRHIW